MNFKKIIYTTLLLSTIYQNLLAENKNNFLLKIPYNFNTKETILEPTISHEGKYNLFSFVDLFKEGYFGQTDITKSIGKTNLKSRIIHNNEIHSKTGFGINKDVNLFNNNVYFNISSLPVWFNNNGFINRQTIDYYFNINLGKGFYTEGFGEFEWNKKKKRSWVYGEIDIGKKINNKLNVSYSPTINNYENKITIDQRIAMIWKL